MGPQEHNVTAMQWRAPLIKLTNISNPDVAGGGPTPVFVQPESIIGIRSTKGSYAVADSMQGWPDKNRRFHPQVECTEVNCSQFLLLVVESPAAVARLRDEAFGVGKPARGISQTSTV